MKQLLHRSFVTNLLLMCIVLATFEGRTNDMQVSQLERFPLEAQVPAMKGYDIRARKIIVPAGGTISEHSHATRAGIVYVESGSIIEYRGESTRKLSAGDSLVEDVTTVHAYRNTSNQDCVLIAFDLPSTQVNQ